MVPSVIALHLVPGYELTQQIYKGDRTYVFRAIRLKDNFPVVIKVMRGEGHSYDELTQFRHQYYLVEKLAIPSVIQVYELLNLRHGYGLVMEDYGGFSLYNLIRVWRHCRQFDLKKRSFRNWRADGQYLQPVTLEEYQKSDFIGDFLKIAIQLVDIIDSLHRHRIIHKDIKPGNILINPENLEIKLIDFSIAIEVPKGERYVEVPMNGEGTLEYISPEQTGRMNMPMDYRTDYYSLGVTLFELLTSEVPFLVRDISETVYMHSSLGVPSPTDRNPKIPQTIANIVRKLMAKQPSERYQSTQGIRFDLQECLDDWLEEGAVGWFRLADQDISGELEIPNRLYGRNGEINVITKAFEHCRIGSSEIVMIIGEEGVGKTSLVEHTVTKLGEAPCFAIRGEFSPGDENIPLSGFTKAFRDLVLQVCRLNNYAYIYWRDQMLSAIGEDFTAIAEYLPEVRILLEDMDEEEADEEIKQLSIKAATQKRSQDNTSKLDENLIGTVFRRVIKAIATPEAPLILFFDNMEWTDLESIELMKTILIENHYVPALPTLESTYNQDYQAPELDLTSILIIASYQYSEDRIDHPVELAFEAIERLDVYSTLIELNNLSQGDISRIIRDTIDHQEVEFITLTQMIYTYSKGNARKFHYFFRQLRRDELLMYNWQQQKWLYDLEGIRQKAVIPEVINRIIRDMKKYDWVIHRSLKLAGCIGQVFDLRTLMVLRGNDMEWTNIELQTPILEGVVFPVEESYFLTSFQPDSLEDYIPEYHYIEEIAMTMDYELEDFRGYVVPKLKSQPVVYWFVDEQIRKAAYELIPESERASIHLRNGYYLLQYLTETEREDMLLEVARQFNFAAHLITEKEESIGLAQLNLYAGSKYFDDKNYTKAYENLSIGISKLPDDCWLNNYQLSYELYNKGAKSAYQSGHLDDAIDYTQAIIDNVKTLEEKTDIFEIRIQALGAKGRATEAVKFALEVLKLFGIEFPDDPSSVDVENKFKEISLKLSHQEVEDILNHKQDLDDQTLTIIGLLANIIVFAYKIDQKLSILISIKQIEISLQHGNIPTAGFAYCVYGIFTCGIVGDVVSGYKYGEVSLKLLEYNGNQSIKSKVIEAFYQLISHWKRHLRETLVPLEYNYLSALEVRDLEFAAYSLYAYSYHIYFSGFELNHSVHKILDNGRKISHINQHIIYDYTRIYQQMVHNLVEVIREPYILEGIYFREEEILGFTRNKDGIACAIFYFCKLHLLYLFGKFSEAYKYSQNFTEYSYAAVGTILIPQSSFYTSLILISLCQQNNQEQFTQEINHNISKMRYWAEHAPMNYLHKADLIEAELKRVTGNYVEAMELYDKAIIGAKENEYLHEEALANELAGKFYLEWGREIIASTYINQAYQLYIRWGARAKAKHLADTYPQFLSNNLIYLEMALDGSDSLNEKDTQVKAELAYRYLEESLENIEPSERQSLRASSTHSLHSIDLNNILEASQTIVEQVDLNVMLRMLMEIITKNACATKTCLILPRKNIFDLTISAICQVVDSKLETSFCSIPIEEAIDEIPLSVVNFVRRAKQIINYHDALNEPKLAKEKYVQENFIASLLCIPVFKQRKLIGVFYLENTYLTGAFNDNRLEVIKHLTTQAIISLENIKLYQDLQASKRDLEVKVEERTKELGEKNQILESTLQNLQSTQMQLIQSEKMSSLGQMVAGIAHEINNPINFIHGNINYANDYVQDLLELIEIYRQEDNKAISPAIQAKIEEMDLDFVCDDLHRLFDSMKMGSSRIRNIVLGLRNFSRLDESEMKAVNIHEGIDNTLMIIQHRIKENSKRPAIEIIKEYADIPAINCHAGQLNQVFMNLLANAADALDDKDWVSISDREKSNHQPQIRIITEKVDSKNIRIRIADNGCGMSEKVRNDIFNPFFTTKPVGSGTGLGLSISYKIVVEMHKGKLDCNSILGEGTEFVIEIPMQQNT